MKVLVVDNETNIRQSVVEMLKAFCPDATEIKEADSVAAGLEVAVNSRPDVIFLDVELGDGTGMDLLSKLGKTEAHVIFITAHNKYAVDAFRHSAIDFLLKPINPEELMLAFSKAKDAVGNQYLKEQLQVLKEYMAASTAADKKIVLKDSESIYFVKVSDIIRCESEKSYTTFVLSNSPNIVISKGIKDFEEILEKYGFVRTHQSHLINMAKIKRFDRADGGSIVMENNDIVPVSQRKREQIMETFKNL